MKMTDAALNLAPPAADWLRTYSYARFAFSAAWVAAAFTVGTANSTVAGVLLVIYPAWDAVANYVDAARNGGFAANRSQLVNTIISVVTTAAVGGALTLGMGAVVVAYGVWAMLSGVLQLLTAVRRRRAGGQWAMVLSGAQSALAGVFFVAAGSSGPTAGIGLIAPYAAFGAFYFLVSAVWLTVRRRAS
jgi:uncharacterized membrane protein HdeD (DUF308 family)